MAGRPNLLILHTDQQSAWTLGAYGGRLVGTPNADRIAREGAVFANFFTNSALCTPSRGCFFTGRYPHCHGAYDNNIELNRDEVTLAHLLAMAGYETGYAGKWHLDGPPKPGWLTPQRSMGFAHCRGMFNRGHYKKVAERDGGPPDLAALDGPGRYMTDWLADKTIECLGTASRPFFWTVSFPDPHTPFNVRQPFASMYDPADMPVPGSFRQEGLPGWAERARGAYDGKAAEAGLSPEGLLQRNKAAYCGEVRCIDENVGRILECLERRGLLDETVVVFTTDHGEYMGEHGLYHKNHVYETAYRIPLLVRFPAGVRRGTIVDRCVSTVDFQQTILGLLGVAPSGAEQGRDASPLLRGQEIEWADEAFIHHSTFGFAGIFTRQHQLCLARCGDHVFFDRLGDPGQVTNLITEPSHRRVREELAARIVDHNRRLDSPAMAWLEKVT